jgi:hypothetical protein
LLGGKLRLIDYRKRSKSLTARIFYGKKAEKEALYQELIPLACRVVKQSEMAIAQVRSHYNFVMARFVPMRDRLAK